MIEFWPWHTNQRKDSNAVRADAVIVKASSPPGQLYIGLYKRFNEFWDLILQKSLAFEIRPWGPNQHFGAFGCNGCPPPNLDGDGDRPCDLKEMAALHWAAAEGHFPLIIRLRDRGLKYYMHHERYNQRTLVSACRSGNLEIVKILLGARANPSDKDVLSTVCEEGHLQLLEYLLEFIHERSLFLEMTNEESVNPQQEAIERGMKMTFGPERKSLGHIAAERGHLDMVIYLLEGKSELRYGDAKERLPLHYAALEGQNEVISWLLANFAIVRNGDESLFLSYTSRAQSNDGETALMLATKHGHAKAVEILLKDDPASAEIQCFLRPKIPLEFPTDLLTSGRSFSQRSERPIGYWAIHFAAEAGFAEILSMFSPDQLTRDVSVDLSQMTVEDRVNMKPLHLAVLHGHTSATKIILDKTGEPEGFSRKLPAKRNLGSVGISTLHMATAIDCAPVIEVLLAAGADPNLLTLGGLAPLHIAAIYNKANAVRALLSLDGETNAQIDLEARVPQNRLLSTKYATTLSPLAIALHQGHAEVARALVSAGADAKRAILESSYHIDAANQIQMVCELCENEPSLSFRKNPREASYILSSAARHGTVGQVRFLLDHEAYDWDFEGKFRALSAAVGRGSADVVQALLNRPEMYLSSKETFLNTMPSRVLSKGRLRIRDDTEIETLLRDFVQKHNLSHD